MESLKIISEIQELTALNRKGVEALYEAEEELAHAENELDTLEAKAFLDAEGSVAWLLRVEADTPDGPLMVPGWGKPKTGIVKRDPEMIEGLVATADRLWRFVNGGNYGTV